LLSELIASKYNLDLWIPKGGYFIMAGISRCKIDDKYMVDEYGNRRPRDYAFCLQLAYEQRVVAIPCSVFYSKKD
jgi:aspartate/methionine/tyrosine aminotransferase